MELRLRSVGLRWGNALVGASLVAAAFLGVACDSDSDGGSGGAGGEASGGTSSGGASSGGASSGGSSSGSGGSDSEEEFTGTYTIGGETYDCKVSTQTFVGDEFSIVCQNDDHGLVQVTFFDEDSARVEQQFTLVERLASGLKEEIQVGVSFLSFGSEPELSSRDDSTGWLRVDAEGGHSKIVAEDVTLLDVTKEVDGTVSFEIEF